MVTGISKSQCARSADCCAAVTSLTDSVWAKEASHKGALPVRSHSESVYIKFKKTQNYIIGGDRGQQSHFLWAGY